MGGVMIGIMPDSGDSSTSGHARSEALPRNALSNRLLPVGREPAATTRAVCKSRTAAIRRTARDQCGFTADRQEPVGQCVPRRSLGTRFWAKFAGLFPKELL